MSDYTQTTDFSAKDALPSGNPAKVIQGADFDTEFGNIQTANNTKLNTASPAFTGTMTGLAITLTGTLEANLVDGGTY